MVAKSQESREWLDQTTRPQRRWIDSLVLDFRVYQPGFRTRLESEVLSEDPESPIPLNKGMYSLNHNMKPYII